MKKPVVLAILDGWGLSEEKEGNAIYLAQTPCMDAICQKAAQTELLCFGEAVGLPEGQQGNSEVGHLNLGAGRVVYQDLTRINKAIREHTFEKNRPLNEAMDACQKGHTLHLMGLLSKGGVHSHSAHLYALLKMAKAKSVEKVYIHAFLDGRDVPPASALEDIRELEQVIQEVGVGEIVTVSGRYYAMDRDNRWERIEKAYRAIVSGEGPLVKTAEEAVQQSYDKGETDEFVLPTVVGDHLVNKERVQDGDSVIFYNFRADRARELTQAFVEEDFKGFSRPFKKIHFVCMTQYDENIKVPVAYPPEDLINTLSEVIAKAGMKQFHTAETEKYAHVTFFFNGGREEAFAEEERLLIASPKVATYDLKPEMSALEVKEGLLQALAEEKYDFILVNFANADMVGHTGKLDAAIQAVETVDRMVGEIAEAVQKHQGMFIITADHGNAEKMVNMDTKEPFTAHTAHKVPFIVLGKEVSLHSGALEDVAPTVLELLGLEKPKEMTGNSLINH